MKKKSIEKKHSLYINIICPLIIVTILACAFVAIMINTASKNCINKINSQEMETYTQIVNDMLEREKTTLKKSVVLALSQIDNINTSGSNALAFLDRYLNTFNLYDAYILDENKNLISSVHKDSKPIAISEKQALTEASNNNVLTTIKNNDIIYSCAGKFDNGYIVDAMPIFCKVLTQIIIQFCQ